MLSKYLEMNQMARSATCIKATYEFITCRILTVWLMKTLKINPRIFPPFLVVVGFCLLWIRNKKSDKRNHTLLSYHIDLQGDNDDQ